MTQVAIDSGMRVTGGTTARLRSVLVAVDLTPASDRALARVARLPLADDAVVTLLHVVSGSSLRSERVAAERDARDELAEEVRGLRGTLGRTVRITALVKAGTAAEEIVSCAHAVRAELVVVAHGDGTLRELLLGSTADRVLRQGRVPVLVVRLPARAGYARPALALDFDDAASEVVGVLLRIVQPPRPAVTVIHAVDAPHHRPAYASMSEEAAARLREELVQDASRQLASLLAGATRDLEERRGAPSWQTHIENGAPRLVVAEAVDKAKTDLLLLGTRGHTGLAHLLLGSVAGDLLRDLACDVLVVPPRQPES